MLRLSDFRAYWDSVAERIPAVTEAMAVTVDDEMTKKIMRIPKETATLFWLPPSAEAAARNADSWREANLCVVFVMERYDPQRREAVDVLETSQTVIEDVKRMLLSDMSAGCSPLKIDVSSINTIPETRFFAGFAGWSLGFKIFA